VDTGFTIIEVISAEEFSKISGEMNFPVFNIPQLKAPLQVNREITADPRYGKIFFFFFNLKIFFTPFFLSYGKVFIYEPQPISRYHELLGTKVKKKKKKNFF
jgi:hypothetical protein